MRNFKKILIAICVLALLTTGFAFMVFAEEATDEVEKGTVEELDALIDKFDKLHFDYYDEDIMPEEKDPQKLYDAAVAISEYINSKEIEATEEEKAVLLKRAQTVAVDGARVFLKLISEPNISTETALDRFTKADTLLGLYDLPDDISGFASVGFGGEEAVQELYDKSLVDIAGVLIKDIRADIATKINEKTKMYDTAKNKIAINKLNYIMSYCTPYAESDFTALKEQYDKLVEAHNLAVSQNLAILDSRNDMSEYILPTYYTEDWEDEEVGIGGNDSAGKLTTEGVAATNVIKAAGWNVVDLKGTVNQVGILQEKNGNKYYVHKYLEKEKPAATYIQRPVGYKAENGLVFEFDIATFGEIPAKGIKIESGSIAPNTFPRAYLIINGNGDICTNDDAGAKVLLPGALVKGGWLHITLALNPDDFYYYLYVEGEYIGRYDASLKNGGGKFDHAKASFRLSGGESTQGEVAYDNFKIYAGSNYRDPDRLNKMTDEEKFIYYVDYFTNSDNIKDRTKIAKIKEAYDLTVQLLPTYWVCTDEENGIYEYTDIAKDNEELQEAVQKCIAFDMEKVIAETKAANIETLIEMVVALRAIERKSDNIEERQTLVDQIQEFIDKNKNFIDREADIYPWEYEEVDTGEETDETEEPEEPKKIYIGNGEYDYLEMMDIYNTVIKEIAYDRNAPRFIGYMKSFKSAAVLSATQRYYEFAKSMINDGLIDMELILNTDTPYRENFKELTDAYELYTTAENKISVVSKENNSKIIVQCMDKISIYPTQEEWDANADEMKKYLNIVKDIILIKDNGELRYNPNYNGIENAVRFFERAYGYFYNLLQEEHAAYIGLLLDHMLGTDDYVEKLGIMTLIDRYLATNADDMDLNDARIAPLLENIETCRSELELRDQDYGKFREMNSGYFINYVKNMYTAKTYAEQMEYFEKAAEIYFTLDILVEGTSEAIEIFDEYKIKLEEITANSAAFLEAVAIYNACETEDDKYAALVECYYYSQLADITYEGVEEAMAEYKAVYDDYVGYANAVNADIDTTAHAVCSFRTNCGITTIIAIIVKKIFEL